MKVHRTITTFIAVLALVHGISAFSGGFAEDGKESSTTKSSIAIKYPYAPYNEGKLDPQLTGWPLTAEERAWVLKSESSRKPGQEVEQNLPRMWPVTPTAGYLGKGEGDPRWINLHAAIVKNTQGRKYPLDVLLLGDSITQNLGGGANGKPFHKSWQKNFGKFRSVNSGIGGDKTENVLWRLEHGAIEGANPGCVILLIGTNNTSQVGDDGARSSDVAQGILLCVQSIRAKSADSQIVVVKILPGDDPESKVRKSIDTINQDLVNLKLDSDPKVHLVDLSSELTESDGSLLKAAYSDGRLHLSDAGYEIYTQRLKLVVEELLSAGDDRKGP